MDDELDLQLSQLVYAAQAYPAKSAERRKVLNKLIAKIQSSGKLKNFLEWREKLTYFPDIYSPHSAPQLSQSVITEKKIFNKKKMILLVE